MKVRCIKEFKTNGKEHKVDDVLNVSKEECSLLLSQRLCVMVIEEPKIENKKLPKKNIEKKSK